MVISYRGILRILATHELMERQISGIPRAGLYLLIADVTVQSHSGHPTRGCIPRIPAIGHSAQQSRVEISSSLFFFITLDEVPEGHGA